MYLIHTLSIFVSYSAYQIYQPSYPGCTSLAFRYVLDFPPQGLCLHLSFFYKSLPSYPNSICLSRPNLNSSFVEELLTSAAHHCVFLCSFSYPCHLRDIWKHQGSNKRRWHVYWNMRECFLLSIKEKLVRAGNYSQWEKVKVPHRGRSVRHADAFMAIR